MKKIMFTAILALHFLPALFAQNQAKMITVNFEDKRDDGVKVNLSLPLSFLESLKPQIQQMLAQVEQGDVPVDFVGLWQAIKETGPNDYLEVNNEDGHIKVSTTESHLICHVDSQKEGEIRVTIPLAVGEALIGSSDKFDYDHLVAALESMNGKDLVTIEGEFVSGFVRIE